MRKLKLILPMLFLILLLGGIPQTYGQDIPILMYHDVVDSNPTNEAIITLSKLTKDFTYLKREGYSFLTLEDLVVLEEYPEKSIVITFDDGYKSNYDKAFPLMKKLNIKASISLIGYYLNKKDVDGAKQRPKLTIANIHEMQASGLIDFQNHTYNSHYLDGYTFGGARVGKGILSYEGEEKEAYKERISFDILMNHIYITYLTQDIPEFFCFPYGVYNDTVINLLKTLGYKGTITTNKGTNELTPVTSKYQLNRFNVTETTDLSILLGGE